MIKLLSSSFLTFFFVVVIGAAHADTIRSTSSGNWSDSNTWEGGVVPAATDDVVISDDHTVHLDINPADNEPHALCVSLTVEQDGVLQLGYDGADLNKEFLLTGGISCQGTIAAGRNVPEDIYSGEGLLYEHNSSLILQLTADTTFLTGKGYFHPQNLIIKNESSEKQLTIDHYNVSVDEDFYMEGRAPIHLLIDQYAYVRVLGSLNVNGKTYTASTSELSAHMEVLGIVHAADVGLYTKHETASSSITAQGEGVITANQMNGGQSITNTTGGFELILSDESIFRLGEGVTSPETLAETFPNLTVTTNGRIKPHFSGELTAASEVLAQVEGFDKDDYHQVRPIKEKVGASHIAGWYNFSDQPYLLEGKNRFKEWGSVNIKTTISANNGKMFEAYPFNHEWDSFDEPAEVIQHPLQDSLFSDTYFKTHAFWSPSKGVNGYYKRGADRNHDRFLDTENQIYNAAKTILENYGHLDKTFIFQNWEGDWMLRGSNRQWGSDPETIPDDIAWQVEGMARMWRAHMRGIEKAIAEHPKAVARVQYSVEFNKLFRNVNGTRQTMMDLNVPSVVANVLPRVRMHLSSWSAYDGNFEEDERPFPTGYWNGLEIAAYYTNDTKGQEGFPVQLGEIGMNENEPFQNLTDETIRDRYDKLVGMVSALDVPNVYLWNLYGSGEQSVDLEKGEQYETDFLYEVLDGKWVIEPDNSFGVAGQHIKDNYFIPDNEAPIINQPVDDLDLAFGFETYSLILSEIYSDPEGDELTYSAASSDEGVATVNIEGDTLVIVEIAAGESQIQLGASDGISDAAAVSFQLRIGENSSPTRELTLEDQSYEVGFGTDTLDITGTFTDADGDELTYTVTVVDESVVTASLSDTHLFLTEAGTGTTAITLKAADGNGGSSSTQFEVEVNTPIVATSTVSIGSESFASVAAALDNAAAGDTIEIRGVHTESFSISKNITIRGEDPTQDILQAATSLTASTARVISISRPDDTFADLTVNIENLGIRYGSSDQNGGGINADKVDGLLTLTNLIIEQNRSEKNGGGVSLAGTNATIVHCTFQQNEATLDGGALIVAPNNGAGIDNEINIRQTLIDRNEARNGGGIYLNGNKDFGNDQTLSLLIENTTITHNTANSGSDAAGGGGIWSKSAFWTGDGTTANVSLRMVHVTMYDNQHASTAKNGIQFTSTPAGALTKFSLYNSIVVSADDLAEKAINFTNANTTVAVNNILGGINGADEDLIDAEENNNEKGKTATFAGLSGVLSDEGGQVQVMTLEAGSVSINYCVEEIDIEGPDTDARDVDRDDTPDAGAYEALLVNQAPEVSSSLSDLSLEVGFGKTTLRLEEVFTDPEHEALTFLVSVVDEEVVTAAVLDSTLTLTEVGAGTTTVSVTAVDGSGAEVTDDFFVTVGQNAVPVPEINFEDRDYEEGFGVDTLSISGAFTDADRDVLTYSVDVEDETIVVATISNESLILTEEGIGSTTLTLSVDDGNGGTANIDFAVTVSATDLETNRIPEVINALDDLTLNEGFEALSINLDNTFADPDGDALTFSVTLSEEGVVRVTLTDNLLSIEEQGLGNTILTVAADDGSGGITIDDFAISVQELDNVPPRLEMPFEDAFFEVGFTWSTIELADRFVDEDGDELTFTAEVLTENVLSAQVEGSTLLITELGRGATEMVITAADGEGGVAMDSLVITVGSEVLSIREAQEITLFPNPASDHFSLDLGHASGTVRVSTMSGKIVLTATYQPEKQYPIHDLKPGIYLLEVRLGEQWWTGKLLKD